MTHSSRGLRTQILLALTAAFALSFTGLGMVVVKLIQGADRTEHHRRAQATASALAAGLDATDWNDPAATTEVANRREDILASAVGQLDVAGLALTTPTGTVRAHGHTRGPWDARASLRNGEELRLWSSNPDPTRAAPLSNLLRLYLFSTGAAILLAVYIALTHLIVRPVEELTRASERLARGVSSTQVPEQGAAEVARLAAAFNRMAVDLADERARLRARLDELEHATKGLHTAQDQLIRGEKLASVGRLAAGVAHEIGNPLAAILGLLELLQGNDLSDAEQQEFLARIQHETERIHRIIRDLLDYSRSTPDTAEPAPSADVAAVVEDAVKLIAPQKDLGGVTIERRAAPDVPYVRMPADALTQVVLNLLLNAADAVQNQGGILVEVELDSEKQRVRLAVTDTGPGISPEVCATLFDPFVTTKRAGEGTGLGLSVCQALVERYGGHIRADAAAQGGARFVVELDPAPDEPA